MANQADPADLFVPVRFAGLKGWRTALFIAVTTVFALPGCSRPPEPPGAEPAAGTTTVVGAGSTFAAVLFERWFKAYHTSHPTTVVRYDPVGSGEGVRRFIGLNVDADKRVHFAASDSAMSDAELAQTNNSTVMVPITAGCVVLAYNLPAVHQPLKLSRDAYVGIFFGEVNKWNDPRIAATNAGVALPDLAIGRAVRQDSSGTTFAFTSHLAAISERWSHRFRPGTSLDWPGDAIRGKGNEGVAGLVRNFEGAIGYVGYEVAHRIGLQIAALENREGKFVQPTGESCAAALATVTLPENLRAFVPDPAGPDSYPIVTFSWVLLRKASGDPAQRAALLDLVRWCLQDGQRVASEVDYVPLPPNVVTRALEALNGA